MELDTRYMRLVGLEITHLGAVVQNTITLEPRSQQLVYQFKPVTDEQVFYDKFLYGKFYLPSARVYVRQILYDKFRFLDRHDSYYFSLQQ